MLDDLRARAHRWSGKYTHILHPGREVEDPFEGQPAWLLPEGTLFVSEGKLYRVTETGGGFNFAVPWGGNDRQKVALDPQSLVARFHRVVAYGEPLPSYTGKDQLLDGSERVLCFVFENAAQAGRAGQLDEAVAGRTGLRLQGLRNGLLGLTDGFHPYRLYAHQPPGVEMFERLTLPGPRQVAVLDAADGPYYWAYLNQAQAGTHTRTNNQGLA